VLEIVDCKGGCAFEAGDDAGDAFGFEGLDEALGGIGKGVGFVGLVFHGCVVGTEPRADFV